jgi:hypothetical protein
MSQEYAISTIKEGIPEHYKNFSLFDLEGEIWRPIAGYEGVYEVSNMGRIKSLEREKWNGRSYQKIKETILPPRPRDERGYLCVGLNREGKTSLKYVQILVGLHFIPNPLKKRTVNHKWGIKWDNRASQLEWNTHREQHLHAWRVLGRRHPGKGKTGDQSPCSKKVLCITNGIMYGSVAEAGRELNLSFQNISKVCYGVRHHTGGYSFKFVEDGSDNNS